MASRVPESNYRMWVNTPRVSVLMPVHNARPFVLEAVDSVLRQTMADFELIVVDDLSTDGSYDLLSSIADPRLRLHRNPGRVGVAATLNRCLELASGEIVARMDADDVSLVDRFERQVRYLESRPDVAVLGGECILIDVYGAARGYLERRHCPALVGWELHFANQLAHASVMMRSAAVRSVGGYSTAVPYAEDYDLWMRLSYRHRLANLPEPLIRLRQHPGQMSARFAADQSLNAQAIRAAGLSRTLGRPVTPSEFGSWVKAARKERLPSAAALRTVSTMLAQAVGRYVAQQRLSVPEARTVRRRAADRLMLLGKLHAGSHRTTSIAVLGRALALDPGRIGLKLGRAAAKAAKRGA